MGVIAGCLLLSAYCAAQCSGTVTIAGGGCEGTKLYAVTTGGGAVQQLIWKSRSRNNEVVHTTNATAYSADGTTVAGGNGKGAGANQFQSTVGITMDKTGSLFIVDLNSVCKKTAPILISLCVNLKFCE